MEPSDQDLVRGAAAGDHAAFHVLIDRHGRGLLRVALALSGNRPDADDACQEALVAAFRGIKAFRGGASVKTWLTRILIRKASRAWKKDRRRGRRTLPLHGPDRPAGQSRDDVGGALAGEVSVPAATLTTDQRLDVLEAIRSLPTEFRDTVILREIEGMSYQDIADTLGVPRGTVESRLHRGRAELRRKLTGY